MKSKLVVGIGIFTAVVITAFITPSAVYSKDLGLIRLVINENIRKDLQQEINRV